MTLTLERLQTALAPRAVRFFERCDSTNDLAMDWLRAGAPSGAVVIADEQLRGRGRMGRTWYTPPGVALAVSVVLHPAPPQLPYVSLMGAVAIAELCEYLGAENVGIKWPNDVHLHGRKVSGVLPEAAWRGNILLGVVLGMGINIRIDFTGTELAQTAISIEPALGKPVDRAAALKVLLARIDHWAMQLDSRALFDTWKRHLTSIGQLVSIEGASGRVNGRAEGVDSHGALLVRSADGALHRVVAGDIALTPPNQDARSEHAEKTW